MIASPHRDWLARSLLGGQAVAEVESALLDDRSARVWMTDQAVAITHVKRVMEIYAAGGSLASIQREWPKVEAHAREQDCNAILIAGRPGWGRALGSGFTPVSFLVKEL